jgi:hypothetical protein
LIDDVVDTEEIVQKQYVEKEVEVIQVLQTEDVLDDGKVSNVIMKDDRLAFESCGDMNPNCLHTFLMKQMRESIKSLWEKLGSTYSISIHHAAFEIELLELSLVYKIDNIIPILYKDIIIGHNPPDFMIEGLLRIHMTVIHHETFDHALPTMFVRFSKVFPNSTL